jgi:hypothetical protein
MTQHPDDVAVDAFAQAMKEKMKKSRDKGRGGWQQMDEGTLTGMLREHIDKGDMRDVGNFAMMIWNNSQTEETRVKDPYFVEACVDFLARYPDLNKPEEAFDNCQFYSDAFIAAYPKFKGKLLHLSGYRNKLENRYAGWDECTNPTSHFYHCICKMDSLTVDVTHKQLDTQDAPIMVKSMKEIEKEWLVVATDISYILTLAEIEGYVNDKNREKAKAAYHATIDALKSGDLILTGTGKDNVLIRKMHLWKPMLEGEYDVRSPRPWPEPVKLLDEYFLNEVLSRSRNCLIPWYLMTCFAYYHRDVSLISDELFDQICVWLDEEFDNLEHVHKSYVKRDAGSAKGQAYSLREEEYPSMSIYSARSLISKSGDPWEGRKSTQAEFDF